MKEILRYDDHTTLEVYCELWKLKILEKDLIPIITLNQDPLDNTQSRLTLVCGKFRSVNFDINLLVRRIRMHF